VGQFGMGIYGLVSGGRRVVVDEVDDATPFSKGVTMDSPKVSLGPAAMLYASTPCGGGRTWNSCKAIPSRAACGPLLQSMP
jgi:hypothetical protein